MQSHLNSKKTQDKSITIFHIAKQYMKTQMQLCQVKKVITINPKVYKVKLLSDTCSCEHNQRWLLEILKYLKIDHHSPEDWSKYLKIFLPCRREVHSASYIIDKMPTAAKVLEMQIAKVKHVYIYNTRLTVRYAEQLPRAKYPMYQKFVQKHGVIWYCI